MHIQIVSNLGLTQLRSLPVDSTGGTRLLSGSQRDPAGIGFWAFSSLEFGRSLRTRTVLLFIFITPVSRTALPST